MRYIQQPCMADTGEHLQGKWNKCIRQLVVLVSVESFRRERNQTKCNQKKNKNMLRVIFNLLVPNIHLSFFLSLLQKLKSCKRNWPDKIIFPSHLATCYIMFKINKTPVNQKTIATWGNSAKCCILNPNCATLTMVNILFNNIHKFAWLPPHLITSEIPAKACPKDSKQIIEKKTGTVIGGLWLTRNMARPPQQAKTLHFWPLGRFV